MQCYDKSNTEIEINSILILYFYSFYSCFTFSLKFAFFCLYIVILLNSHLSASQFVHVCYCKNKYTVSLQIFSLKTYKPNIYNTENNKARCFLSLPFYKTYLFLVWRIKHSRFNNSSTKSFSLITMAALMTLAKLIENITCVHDWYKHSNIFENNRTYENISSLPNRNHAWILSVKS